MRFEVSISYIGKDAEGFEKKMKSVIWLNAEIFGEAEAKAYEQFQGIDFKITGIKTSKISDFIGDQDSECFFVAKVKHATIDESTGKEKSATIPVLIAAVDIDDAKKVLDEWLTVFLVPVEVKSIGVSNITEIQL